MGVAHVCKCAILRNLTCSLSSAIQIVQSLLKYFLVQSIRSQISIYEINIYRLNTLNPSTYKTWSLLLIFSTGPVARCSKMCHTVHDYFWWLKSLNHLHTDYTKNRAKTNMGKTPNSSFNNQVYSLYIPLLRPLKIDLISHWNNLRKLALIPPKSLP